MNTEYDPPAEEPDANRRIVSGSVLDRFGDTRGDEDRPVTASLADPDEPDADEPRHPLSGTLADPGDTEPDETDHPPSGTTAEPDEPYTSETGHPLAGTTATTDEPFGAAGPLPHELGGPLIGDAAGLRSNWQHLQAGFVDDPRAAVGDAADLVEHAAQAFVGALQQRQRALRDMWSGEGSTGDKDTMDTERLRQAMQRYRALFNEICPPQP